MPKGPLLTSQIIGLIASIHREHPKWKAPMVRNEVESLLRRRNPDSPRNFPSLSAVQKVLATVRKGEQHLADLEEDKPWTLDALRKNPIPPEALSKVFQIWLYKQANPTLPPLTIREARWIAQLSGMTDDIERLRIMADTCGEWELIGDLTNSPQLSSPGTILYIYSRLTRMPEEAENEYYQEIRREKHPSVSRPRREQVVKCLGAIYGDEFLQAMKLKPKSKRGKKEAQHERFNKKKKPK